MRDTRWQLLSLPVERLIPPGEVVGRPVEAKVESPEHSHPVGGPRQRHDLPEVKASGVPWLDADRDEGKPVGEHTQVGEEV